MWQTKNPDYKELIEEKLTRQYFMRHIGFELTRIEPGYVEGELQFNKEVHGQQNNFAHGGVISTISDIVTGFAAFSLVEADKHVVTAEIKISYLRPGIGEKLIAKGRVLKPGSRFHFCEAEVWAVNNGEEKLIAKATTTMAVVDKF